MPRVCRRAIEPSPELAWSKRLSPASGVEHVFYARRRGTNRRYADSLQRKRFNCEAEAHALIARSLSEAELGQDENTRGPSVPVKVWVDYGNATVQVLGSAVAWTKRAVLVLWVDSHDQQQEAWVWAGAVERVSP